MCGTCGCSDHHHHADEGKLSHEQMHALGIEHHHHQKQSIVEIEKDILSHNNSMAERIRGYLEAKHIYAINLVSSPGSGKTSLLEATIKAIKDKVCVSVIEGDQRTSNDADRIRDLGVNTVQINTETGCHLEADEIYHMVKQMNLSDSSLLFIENIGNLVCPAMFDLGENERVVMISVTEGDDKPLKYPFMFESAQICIINKIDLLPYLQCDIEIIKQNALSINPHLRFFELSVFQGIGVENWISYLLQKIQCNVRRIF